MEGRLLFFSVVMALCLESLHWNVYLTFLYKTSLICACIHSPPSGEAYLRVWIFCRRRVHPDVCRETRSPSVDWFIRFPPKSEMRRPKSIYYPCNLDRPFNSVSHCYGFYNHPFLKIDIKDQRTKLNYY